MESPYPSTFLCEDSKRGFFSFSDFTETKVVSIFIFPILDVALHATKTRYNSKLPTAKICPTKLSISSEENIIMKVYPLPIFWFSLTAHGVQSLPDIGAHG